MPYCSRQVTGQQEAIHPNLPTLVRKHLATDFARPVQAYNRKAVAWLQEQWQNADCAPIILDSGCGTGASSFNLGQRFPDHIIFGIDQSLHRLTKSGAQTGFYSQANVNLVRADLIDCWRLLIAAQLYPAMHFILYPNPWPKKKHIKRRWHGHPAFRDILALGGRLELRSNWQTYVDEFAAALHHAGITTGHKQTLSISNDVYLTPFEKKYAKSGQTLYQLMTEIRPAGLK